MKNNQEHSSDRQYIVDAVFDFSYRMAMRDATLMKAFEGKDKNCLVACEDAKRTVKGYIDGIIVGSEPDFYKTAEAVENDINIFLREKNEPCRFTFGNTQKLINMTAKYLYMTVCRDEETRERFSICHCPMDTVMVDLVIDESDGIDEKDKRELGIDGRGWRTPLRKSWSKIERTDPESLEQYRQFQKIVRFLAEREGVSPIEYDFVHWGSGPKEEQ